MKLYILYEHRCGHCSSARHWLESQPAYFPLEFVPLRSSAAKTWFPGIEIFDQTSPFTGVSESGEVYTGSGAYVMCLYALEKFRELSLRVSVPLLLPFARQIFELAASGGEAAHQWFNRRSNEEIALALEGLPLVACKFASSPAKRPEVVSPGVAP